MIQPAPNSPLQPLLQHYREQQGSFKFSQLKSMSNDSALPQATRQAAQRLLQDANLRHAVDSANDGEIDGEFTAADLRRVLTEESSGGGTAMSMQQVAATLRDNFRLLDACDGDPNDGEFNREALLRIQENPECSPRLREACQAMLRNSHYQRSLSLGLGYGEADQDEWKLDSLQAAAGRGPGGGPDPGSDFLKMQRAGRVLQSHFTRLDRRGDWPGLYGAAFADRPDGKITRQELQVAAQDEGAPQELRNTARLLLSNPAYLASLGEDVITRESLVEARESGQKAALEEVQRLRSQHDSYSGPTPENSNEWNRLRRAEEQVRWQQLLDRSPDHLHALYRAAQLPSDIVDVVGAVADAPGVIRSARRAPLVGGWMGKLNGRLDRVPSKWLNGLGRVGKVLGPVGSLLDGINVADAVSQGDGVRIATSSGSLAGGVLCAVPGGAVVGIPLLIGSWVIDAFTESKQERAEASEEAAHQLFQEQS